MEELMDGQGNNIWIYFLFGGALLIIIALGVVLRLLNRNGKKRVYKPAILLSSDPSRHCQNDPDVRFQKRRQKDL